MNQTSAKDSAPEGCHWINPPEFDGKRAIEESRKIIKEHKNPWFPISKLPTNRQVEDCENNFLVAYVDKYDHGKIKFSHEKFDFEFQYFDVENAMYWMTVPALPTISEKA